MTADEPGWEGLRDLVARAVALTKPDRPVERRQSVIGGEAASGQTLITRLFGVSKVRAVALMQTFGAEMTGNQRIRHTP